MDYKWIQKEKLKEYSILIYTQKYNKESEESEDFSQIFTFDNKQEANSFYEKFKAKLEPTFNYNGSNEGIILFDLRFNNLKSCGMSKTKWEEELNRIERRYKTNLTDTTNMVHTVCLMSQILNHIKADHQIGVKEYILDAIISYPQFVEPYPNDRNKNAILNLDKRFKLKKAVEVQFYKVDKYGHTISNTRRSIYLVPIAENKCFWQQYDKKEYYTILKNLDYKQLSLDILTEFYKWQEYVDSKTT